MRRILAQIALAGAGVALMISLIALIGYAIDVPRLYTMATGLTGMSPLTAVALILLAIAQLAHVRREFVTAQLLGIAAATIGGVTLVCHMVEGDDYLSPWVTRFVFGPVPVAGRTSIGTGLAIFLLGLATLRLFRDRPRLSDTAAAIAVMLSTLALLGYAYSAADLYALRLFHTMALNTAIAIFTLGLASVLSQAEGGWARAIMLEGDLGRTTRRQLLFTFIPPVIGYFLIEAANSGALRLGAAMAFFVVLTVAPLLWLILRDGRALAELDEERGRRRALETEHLRILEAELKAQAVELAHISAERLELAETASLQSENRYRLLFDSIDAGFCVVEIVFDAAGLPIDYRFIEVNKAFEQNTGLADATGRLMRDLAPNHEQHWFDTYGNVAKLQRAARFDLPAKSLGDRWYDVHAFPVDDPALNRVGILFNDATDQKRAQLQLEQMNATLEQRVEAVVAERQQAQAALRQAQKMEAIGQLTGGVAHDFNNLLTPIIGGLDLIARRKDNSERERRLIDGALQSAERAKTLVQRLLAFARRQPLQPGPVDVAAVLQNMGDLASSTLGTQVRVLIDIAKDLPPAMADANQLEMAILNLSVNARDAMPDGGTLSLGAKAEALAEINALGLAPGDYVVLTVSDTGLGMNAETSQRATEPFFSTKGIGKGTGLGLSMVHGLAAQLKGALSINSKLGLGTRIELWLPVATGVPIVETGSGTSAATEAPIRRGRALVVDDEPNVRMITADMLQELGYEIVEVASALEARLLLRDGERVDLIVTDHLMPGMTGADLARLVRKEWPSVRILLVTGYAEADGIAVDLPRLTKPFRQSELAEAIGEIV